MVGKVIGSLGLLFFMAALASGAPATPDDSAVRDISGVAHHPFVPGEKMGSVLIFFLQDCPICNSYAPEINRIAATFTNFAFYIVQVDPDLKPEAAKRHARQYALRPPVLLDPGHDLRDALENIQAGQRVKTKETKAVGCLI